MTEPRGNGLARRARALREVVATPADVALLVRMLGWAAALPVLKRVVPLPRLVRLCSAEPDVEGRRLERERQVATLARWISRPSRLRDENCLERSLVTFRFLSELDADPVLFVGVRKTEEGVVGHAWVTVDGEPVHDSPASVVEFTPLVAFGVGAARVPL